MAKVHARTFEWSFDAPPGALWPALGDTARFNEAAGIPKHTIEEALQDDGRVRFFACAHKGPLGLPIALAWEETPVEWVDHRWFRHCREFSKGPLRMLCATLELEPAGKGGAVGHCKVEVSAANLLGTLVLATMFFPIVRRIFTRLADQAAEWASGTRARPYERPLRALGAEAQARIDHIVERVERSPNGHGLAARLVDWMLRGQEFDLFRIRPIALARHWDVPERHAIEMCLQAVREGFLELRWDLLCPRCRGAKFVVDSLDQLPTDAHCGSCNIYYDRDFARNIEITFHPTAAVREVLDGEFCHFGTATTPHVRVQVKLDPGEARTLPANIAAGDYRLRTLEAAGESDIAFDVGRFPEVVAEAGDVRPGANTAEAGAIVLVDNDAGRRALIVESLEWVADALTAHNVTTMQAFRDLFENETLRPEDEMEVSQITLIFTDLKDSTAFYERVGDAVLAAFGEPADAVRAALAIQEQFRAFNAEPNDGEMILKVGIHAGRSIAVTLNDQLDYFGSTVNLAARLQSEAAGGDIIVSQTLADDPVAPPLLAPSAMTTEERSIKGFAEPVTYHRLSAAALAS
jgi:class 3 adenylate cyclase